MLHQIGAGTLGPVFRGHDTQRERLVAVKLFKLDMAPEQVHQLVAGLERIAAAPLTHASIAAPVAAGLTGISAYLACDYVAADSMDSAVREFGPLAPADALAAAARLASALEHAIAAGFTHGSLHPRDVLLSARETRMTGLGVGQLLAEIGIAPPVRRPYSAPERLAGSAWDRRADVFSLAALVHELLWGKRISGVGAQVVDGMTTLPGGDLDALKRVFKRALAEDPLERHPTAKIFVDALKRALPEVGADAVADDASAAPARNLRLATPPRPAPLMDEPLLPLETRFTEVDVVPDLASPAAGPSILENADDPLDRPLEPRVVVDAVSDASPARGAQDDLELGWLARAPGPSETDPPFDLRTRPEPDAEEPKAVPEPPPPPPEPAAPPPPEPVLERPARPPSRMTRGGGSRARSTNSLLGDTTDAAAQSALSAFKPETPASAPVPAPAERKPAAREERRPEPKEAREGRESDAKEARESARESRESRDRQRETREPRETRDVVEPVPLPTLAAAGEQTVLERSRSAVWPLMLALAIGVALGFAGGYATGVRTQLPGARSATAQPAAPGREFTEGTVSTPSKPAEPAEPAPAPAAAAATPLPTTRAEPPAAAPPVRGAAAPPARAAWTAGRLNVRSSPSGARVSVDDRDVGRTPASVRDLTEGPHRIRITRDGYAPHDRRIVITRTRPVQSVVANLARQGAASPATAGRGAPPAGRAAAPPAPGRAPAPPPGRAPAPESERPMIYTGSLSVASRPGGASVFLNGQLIGRTPMSMPGIRAGDHAIRLQLDGYRNWTGAVRIVADETARVTASLER